MWYEGTGFLIGMLVVSGLIFYMSFKDVFASYENSKKDIDESREYAEKFGKNAIMFFTAITVIISLAYVVLGQIIGLIPATAVYGIVILMLCNLMLENMCLANAMKYNRFVFVFDKVQRVVNVGLSLLVIVGIIPKIL